MSVQLQMSMQINFTTEKVATEKVATEKAATENVVTENVVTENVVTENVVTENVVTENVVTENVVTEKSATENVVSENDITAKFNLIILNLLKDYNEEMQAFKYNKIPPVKKNNKNALLIGCNYKNTKNELNGCINDANNIKQLLTKSYGFDDIVFMTDDTEKTPTKKNILDELKTLLNNANSGDILFFSFSGHGTNLKDTNGDEKDKLDEVMVAIDFNYITDDELNRLIQVNLKKDVTLFALFDCCNSGTILDLRYQYLDSTTANKDTEQLNNLETDGNVIMISGCMDSQTSADAYIKSASSYQGAMTFAFIETLRGNPNASWNDLLMSMREYLKNNKYSQIPQLSSGKKLDLMLEFLYVV